MSPGSDRGGEGDGRFKSRLRRSDSAPVREIFRLLGVLLGLYVAYGLAHGEVYARSGVWGRTFYRDQDAWRYWSTIAIYCGLTVALLFYF